MSCQYFRYSCLQTIKRFCNGLARVTRSSARTDVSLSVSPENFFAELFRLPKISEETRKCRELQGLGRVVRKGDNNFSCIKVLSIAYVLCSLRLPMLKTEGQKQKQNSLLKSYKNELILTTRPWGPFLESPRNFLGL